MAPMKHNNNHSNSSSYGEDVGAAFRQANVLASAYVVDPSASSLKGLHYCTTGAAGAECPPLAAITSTNELALTPKAKSALKHGQGHGHNYSYSHRRGGATLRIRGECERFFCETLRATFLGERSAAQRVSRLTGVHHHQHYQQHHHHQQQQQQQQQHCNNDSDTDSDVIYYDGVGDRARVGPHGQLTPPDDYLSHAMMARNTAGGNSSSGHVTDWMEIWDYAGGNSFRAFVAEDMGEKNLFVYFDANVLGRDLKKALVALIELAEGPFDCSHIVVCIDRSIADEERKPLMNGLQWAGFSLTTLDHWTGGMDVTSSKWLFMGMEL